MKETLPATLPAWELAESTVKEDLLRIGPRLVPRESGLTLEAFESGALKRAKDTYDRELKTASPYDHTLDPCVWVWRFAIRSALDERRWIVGRGGYTTCELSSYTSIHLIQPWDLKSDIDIALTFHAVESDGAYRSSKSIKLLYWNRYSEEQLCRFWHDDYALEHRNDLKTLVHDDTVRLREILKQKYISLIKQSKGSAESHEIKAASEVLEEIRGEE